MLMAIVGFIILLLVAVTFGTITYPTRDELLLIASSAGLLIMAWLSKRDRGTIEEEEGSDS
jgi:hypothetical protein